MPYIDFTVHQFSLPSTVLSHPQSFADKPDGDLLWPSASLPVASQCLTLTQISNFLRNYDQPACYEGLFDPVYPFDGNPQSLIINNSYAPANQPMSTPVTPPLVCDSDFSDSDSLHAWSPPSSPAPLPLQLCPAKSSPRSGSTRQSLKVSSNQVPRISNARIKKNVREERRFPCNICGLKFSRRYNLKTHMLTHDANHQKMYQCDTCDRAFDRKHDRDRHQATVHRHKKAHVCKECKNSFTRKDALKRHICHP